MTALDFPSAPAIGDTYPNPPQTGIPTYKWDGVTWLSKFALGKEYVPLDGSTPMTGLLTLFGDPTTDLQAVPRRYINTTIGVPRSHLAGLTLAAPGGTGTFSIAAGVAMDSTNVAMMTLGSWVKTTGLWVVGSNLGALDTGSTTINTWYHVYLIRRPDTSVVDVCISLSPFAPTFGGSIPAAYTQYRRIGAMKTDGVSQWVAFVQDGDSFAWTATVIDVAGATNPGTAAVSRTLSTPLGIRVTARITAVIQSTNTTSFLLITDLATNDNTAGTTRGNAVVSAVGAAISTFAVTTMEVKTNTSSQVRSRLSTSDANTIFSITTYGWIDRRGRDD